jgi:hypothetical protein
MPLKILKKSGFYYVAYFRKDIHDFIEFRTILETFSKSHTMDQDIVIDLTIDNSMTDGEITVLANVIKRFQGSKRTLWIVTRDAIKSKLDGLNLFKAGNVMLFADHISLFESLNHNPRTSNNRLGRTP